MNRLDIARRIAQIKENRHDPETAHGLEDVLWHDILTYIAHESTDTLCALMAFDALSTRLILFPRWTA